MSTMFPALTHAAAGEATTYAGYAPRTVKWRDAVQVASLTYGFGRRAAKVSLATLDAERQAIRAAVRTSDGRFLKAEWREELVGLIEEASREMRPQPARVY